MEGLSPLSHIPYIADPDRNRPDLAPRELEGST